MLLRVTKNRLIVLICIEINGMGIFESKTKENLYFVDDENVLLVRISMLQNQFSRLHYKVYIYIDIKCINCSIIRGLCMTL